jgi:2-dehydro-3-deoxygalactonokinase
LMAGMVGSNRGWVEASYVPCPAGLEEIAGALCWAEPERTAIVPGLSSDDPPDVMRGEEAQVVGAIAAGLVPADALICHPGTHNKWVTLRGGKINNFKTVMTGELFSLLKEHSILADLLDGPVEVNDVFRSAARFAIFNEALPAELFSVRARVLLGQAKKEDAPSYASGLLIGTDVRIGLSLPTSATVTVIGRPELTKLYAAAIHEASRDAVELDGEQCFLAGVAEIAKRITA